MVCRFAGVLLFILTISGAATAMTLNIATLYPDGTAPVRILQEAGKDIEQATDGRVILRLYTGGSMGDDSAVQRRIRIGQLHGALSQGGAFASHYRDAQVLNLPLLFRSYAEVDHVRAVIDARIRDGYEKAGWIVFGPIDGGFAYLMTSRPVTSVSDLQKQKLWMPANDPASAVAARAFGVSPTPLDVGAVLTSLQTGVINAFAAPPVAALTLQWHGRVTHFTEMPLLYTYGLLGISAKHLQRASEKDQVRVRELLGEATEAINRQAREDNLSAFVALSQQNMTPVQPDENELREWRTVAQTAASELVAKGQISQGMVDMVHGLLADFRADQP